MGYSPRLGTLVVGEIGVGGNFDGLPHGGGEDNLVRGFLAGNTAGFDGLSGPYGKSSKRLLWNSDNLKRNTPEHRLNKLMRLVGSSGRLRVNQEEHNRNLAEITELVEIILRGGDSISTENAYDDGVSF